MDASTLVGMTMKLVALSSKADRKLDFDPAHWI